jgi:hypothetical protein
MKKIEAVIIPSRLDAVRLALERGGICGKLTLTEVQQGDANPPSVRTEGGSSGPLQHRIKDRVDRQRSSGRQNYQRSPAVRTHGFL